MIRKVAQPLNQRSRVGSSGGCLTQIIRKYQPSILTDCEYVCRKCPFSDQLGFTQPSADRKFYTHQRSRLPLVMPPSIANVVTRTRQLTKEPMKKFDLVVLGSGPAAGTVAMACVKAGKSVAIVESRKFGGTCALRGCNPKKVLVHAAEVVDAARRSSGKLCEVDSIKINWSDLIAFKNTFTDGIAEDSRKKFEDAGISTFLGRPQFVGQNQIVVEGEVLEANSIVIATGARPADLDVEGQQHVTLSDQFMNLESLPPRIVFIGGGYISMEFAHVAVRANSDVTILERGDRVLKGFEPAIIDQVQRHADQIGIKLIKSANLTSVEKDDSGVLTVHFDEAKTRRSIQCDLVVHGAGRTPNLDGLSLDTGNVECDASKGIKVNDCLQSVSNPMVFAAGDCAASGQPALTTTAETEANAVADFILNEEDCHSPDYGPVAKAVFTVPPIASVGLTESDAQEQGLNFKVHHHDLSDSGSVRKACVEFASSKVLVDRETDHIIGAHLFGPSASETINLFAIAMASGMTASKLKSTLMAFPTFGYGVRGMF